MTFWWKCGSSPTHHTSPTEVEGISFGDPAAENLIGLWDFTSGADNADTGLADGIAQDGNTFGDATTSSDALRLDGNGHFDTAGADDPFDLSQGTIMVQFSQDNHVGSSPDTIVSRGEYCDRDAEGYFNIQVTAQGAVTVSHHSGEELSLSTSDGFFSAGDEVRVAYSWDENGTGTFVVENVTTGETHTEEFDSTGLSMDIGDNDDENFTFGARESDDGHYDQHFDGHIDYVAIFDTDVVNADGEGIVEGTDGDDLIDTAYTGDPDGDMIDNNDALLEGEVGDDDIVVAGAGDDTVLAGAGNDEVFGGAGNDTLDGADGDDVIYGDADTGSARVPTGETSRESFEWDLSGASDTGNLNGFTQDTGNVDVTFSYETTGVTETEFSTDTQKVHSIDTDGSSADANSSLDSETNGQGNTGTYALDFSDPVEDVSFRINDIDGDGVVTVRAYDADGNEINVDMSGGSHLTLVDSDGQFGADTADSNGGYLEDTAPEYSLLVDIPGPVVRIVIEHTQDGSDNSGINVTDVYYDAPVFEVVDATGESGDDTITGGAGDDIIYGDNGAAGGGGSGSVDNSLTLTIDSQNGYYNGDVLIEITNANGTVTTQTVTTNYDGNIGNTYTVDLAEGDTVRLGITGDEGTSWSNIDGDTLTTIVDADTAILNFEDSTDTDFNDVVITASVSGDVTLSTTGDDVYGGGTGEGGNDTIIGGAGADTIFGEGGADTIIGGNAGDMVDGGSTGDDNDTLDLSTSGPLRIVDETTDPDGNSTSGTVEFLDTTGEVTGTMTFTEIETLILPANADPDAHDDTATVDEDGSVVINVLGNDTDPNGDDLTVMSATSPDGDVTINPDGTLTFAPSDDFNGPTTITYTIDDGNGGTDTAVVTVDVTPVNDDPVAVDDTATVAFDTPTEIDVLGNDTDADGDDLSILGTPTALHGTVSVNPDSTLEYTPDTGYDGPDVITYTVSDGNGGTDEGQVAITVEPTPLDGIVSGTAGDDLIDLAYTGDPDGDMVDADDAILAGEVGDDDIIQSGAGDDTVYAGEGNDEITDEEGSDTVYGEAGDDFIDVSGPNSGPNTFDDIVADPSILGDAGLDDTPLPDGVPYDSLQDANPTDDIDYVDGGDGDDTIITGDDADTVFGGSGNDTIYSGIDDDTVYGGDGDDIIIDVQGSDIVDGGAGDDYINVGTDTFSDYVGDDPALPNGLYPYATDQNTADGQDIVHGGAGNDTILTGDDADIVYGDQGDDIIDAGIDDDEVYGGSGNDTITGGHGSDIIYGGTGDDIINAGDIDSVMNHTDETDDTDPVPTNDMDYVRGGGGNDTITGGDDADTLYGDAGDDYLDGGIDDDYLSGGAGADTIIGGQGNDTLVSDNDDDIDILDAGEGDDTLFVGTNDIADAGEGDDTATVRGENATLDMGDGDDFVTVTNDAAGADIMGSAGRDTFDINNAPGTVADPSTMTIDGGSEGDDYDVLDLTGSVVDNGSFEVNITGPDSNGNGFDGVVTYFDESGDVTGTLEFSEIENVIPCFTPGTMIATPKGERDVSQLVVGDKIITRDNGLQAIRWIGSKTLSAAELMLRKELYPVMIRQGALGNGLPERDMMVSPNHRMLVASEKASLYFDDREVLVAAKHLTKMDGVELMGTQSVTYIHMMFDRHEVILSDGTWSESFQPGDFTLAGIGEDQREEIFSLFPELREQSGRGHYETARRVLRKHEAELLVS